MKDQNETTKYAKVAENTQAECAEIKDKFEISSLVSVMDGKMFTTSLMVAKIFGKRHDNVLRDIETLECSEGFHRLNFEETHYVEKQNGQTYPAFNITRDGFAFLAMGFTGKKAAAWKEKFLEAFNAMEIELYSKGRKERKKLHNYRHALNSIAEIISFRQSRCERLLSEKNRKISYLRAVIAYWAFVDDISYATAEYAAIMSQGLHSLEDLPDEKEVFEKLSQFVSNMMGRPVVAEEPKASRDSLTIFRNILLGLDYFVSPSEENINGELSFLTGGRTFDRMDDVSQKDMCKLISGAWGIFSYYKGGCQLDTDAPQKIREIVFNSQDNY